MNYKRSEVRNKSSISARNSHPRSNIQRSSTQTSNRRSCPYFLLCREYLSSLHWEQTYFNSHYDRCYCSECYSENKTNSYLIANNPYVIPRGWARIGLHVDAVKAQVEDIWRTWHNTYHGTNSTAAFSIISHGQFLLNGDVCESGQQLNGGCPYLFTSPTIKYSARYAYAKPREFVASNGVRYQAKIVLQCKQKPGSYQVRGATGNARREGKLCNVIPNDRIEYFTDIRSSVIPYGVMVQLEPSDD